MHRNWGFRPSPCLQVLNWPFVKILVDPQGHVVLTDWWRLEDLQAYTADGGLAQVDLFVGHNRPASVTCRGKGVCCQGLRWQEAS